MCDVQAAATGSHDAAARLLLLLRRLLVHGGDGNEEAESEQVIDVYAEFQLAVLISSLRLGLEASALFKGDAVSLFGDVMGNAG